MFRGYIRYVRNSLQNLPKFTNFSPSSTIIINNN